MTTTRTAYSRWRSWRLALPALLVLPACAGAPTDEQETALASAFHAGTYLLYDSSSFAIDGGYFGLSGKTTEMVYALTPSNGYQQWKFAASGSGFSICNVKAANACLSDGGSTLDVGVGTDVFTVTPSGSGYTLKDQRTGRFISDVSSPANNAPVPVSSKATVWTIPSTGGSTTPPPSSGSTLEAGTYLMSDSASLAIDGGFYGNNGTTTEMVYALTPSNGYQQWIFAASGSGFTICNVKAAKACLSDGGSDLDIGVGEDTWTATSSGSGFTLKNQRTGRFISDVSPLANESVVPVSSTATAWTLTSTGGSSTPPPSGGTVTVDDSDPSIIYSRSEGDGGWETVRNSSLYGGSDHYNGACLVHPQSVPIQGPMAVINFDGTGISMIGMHGNDLGIGAYAIDGGPITKVDTYASAADVYQQKIFSVSGLAAGSHVLSYQVTCNKNASSSGYDQVIDAFQVTGTPLSASSAQAGIWDEVALGGTWSKLKDSTNLSGGQVYSGTAGNTISWTFTGSLVEMFGRPDVGDGLFDVYIDSVRVAASVDSHYSNVDDDLLTGYMLWAGKVSPGKHTIKIVVLGKEDSYDEAEKSGQKDLIQFDEFLAFP